MRQLYLKSQFLDLKGKMAMLLKGKGQILQDRVKKLKATTEIYLIILLIRSGIKMFPVLFGRIHQVKLLQMP